MDAIHIVAGIGNYTGGKLSCLVVKLALEMGIKVKATVTTPFSFEGKRRASKAKENFSNITESL